MADRPSDGVLIKFKPGADRAEVRSRLGLVNVERLNGDSSVIVADTSGSDEAVANRAENLPGVERASPDFMLPVEAIRPNDPGFTDQWYLENTGSGQPPGSYVVGEDLGVLDAWDVTQGAGSIVAVIDTGVDTSHPDLQSQLWVNPDPNGDPRYPGSTHGWNFVDESPDISDGNGHGTILSGIIAAESNNAFGISGIAPGAKIMGLKAGADDTIQLSSALEAAHFAGTHGANVVNMSFGSAKTEFDYWWSDIMLSYPDMLFVHSAGNVGEDIDTYGGYFPCESSIRNSICVAATTRNGDLWFRSNYGSKVEVGAPGGNIYSTQPNGGFDWGSGTSQAAAAASGVAALIQSNSPRAAGSFMRDKLIEGGVDLPALSDFTATGKRVSAYGSVLLTDTVNPDTILHNVDSPVPASSHFFYSMDKPSESNRFECSLNDSTFRRCDGGFTVVNVDTVGPHTFKVRALDDAGNYDPTPAETTFTADVVPPDTTITAKPDRFTRSRAATFSFQSEPGARFECRLDENPFILCTSPETLAINLNAGEHTFEVRAIDEIGNPDPSPATYTWEVLLTDPDTEVSGPCFIGGNCLATSGPGDQVSFGMRSEQADRTGGGYECRLTPPGDWSECSDPVVFQNLSVGSYKFEVRAIDGAGNVDPTPWVKTFTVTNDPDPGGIPNEPDRGGVPNEPDPGGRQNSNGNPPSPLVKPKLILKKQNLRLRKQGIVKVRVKNRNKTALKFKVCVRTLKRRVRTGRCVTARIPRKSQRVFKIKAKALKRGTFKLKVPVFYSGNKKASGKLPVKVR